jgi:hydroxymethylglutaryl-CoA lyase
VSCIFADPYEGPTDPLKVIKVTQALLNAGCYEVSLGDTTGVGTPADVQKLLLAMFKVVPADSLAGHFHDTYGQAIANVVKAYDMGIRTFDSSVAGLGGCPFAKGAKGNLSTEDLLYTLQGMGVKTGVDLDKVVATGTWISKQLNIPNGSRAGVALAANPRRVTSVTAKPTGSRRVWNVVASTPEYQVRRSGVNLYITLTRPRNGNALTLAMIKSLTQLFNQLSTDETVFHIIVGAEGKYFCTGMDLIGPGTSEERFNSLKELFHSIDTSPKVTIAAINGPCLGGGVGLALVCDIRLATSSATFKLSEVRLGLCPATISKYIIREMGFAFARRSMLTAREVKPEELALSQIVHRVVTDQEALKNELDQLLDEMRFVAPHALALTKGLLTAAWVNAGGKEQDRVIETSFKDMMVEGSESERAIEAFRKGIKEVNWELPAQKSYKSKL